MGRSRTRKLRIAHYTGKEILFVILLLREAAMPVAIYDFERNNQISKIGLIVAQ
jgi:hypothetical protein